MLRLYVNHTAAVYKSCCAKTQAVAAMRATPKTRDCAVVRSALIPRLNLLTCKGDVGRIKQLPAGCTSPLATTQPLPRSHCASRVVIGRLAAMLVQHPHSHAMSMARPSRSELSRTSRSGSSSSLMQSHGPMLRCQAAVDLLCLHLRSSLPSQAHE